MFIDNKYTSWYFNIIDNAKARIIYDEYIEKHHIIPIALGGSNDASNLVKLTAKEHFVVHHLLPKMLSDTISKGKMWSAFFLMHIGHENRLTFARTYALSKSEMAKHKKVIYSGENNPYFGKTHSVEIRQKMSDSWNKAAKRNHDTTLYTFQHNDFGTFVCTRRELCEKFNLNQKRIWTLVHKTQKTSFGWRIIWENDQTLKDDQETITKLPRQR